MYVLGFMFSPDGNEVVLVKKNRPAGQNGRLNGVGGKVNSGEGYFEAMVREFEEEAGVHEENWTHYADMNGVDWNCRVFYSFSEKYLDAQTMTDEPIVVENVEYVNRLDSSEAISNIKWLMNLAICASEDEDLVLTTVQYK